MDYSASKLRGAGGSKEGSCASGGLWGGGGGGGVPVGVGGGVGEQDLKRFKEGGGTIQFLFQ